MRAPDACPHSVAARVEYVPWTESVSASFRARHDAAHADDAHRVLLSLERARERLAPTFPGAPGEVTVVLHSGSIALALSHPLVPVWWLATAPAARRYVAGWAGRHELHMLAPSALRVRASNVTGSREMLALTGACLYARLTISRGNPDLQRVMTFVRMRRELRWAWLVEGSARWYGGQTAHARPAIARRLREGTRSISFPPGVRDSPLLGGTVLDLLATECGPPAVARLCRRLPRVGARRALVQAFGGGSSDRAGAALARPSAGNRGRGLTRRRRRSARQHEHQPQDQRTHRQRCQQPEQQTRRGHDRALPRPLVDHGGREQRLARASAPDTGTITSRGPAASMSGTSNPAVRRSRLGTPSSSSSDWMNSPSAWFARPADLRQPALGQLRLDHPRPAVGIGDRLELVRLGRGATAVEHERQPALRAEARVGAGGRVTARADERCDRLAPAHLTARRARSRTPARRRSRRS